MSAYEMKDCIIVCFNKIRPISEQAAVAIHAAKQADKGIRLKHDDKRWENLNIST